MKMTQDHLLGIQISRSEVAAAKIKYSAFNSEMKITIQSLHFAMILQYNSLRLVVFGTKDGQMATPNHCIHGNHEHVIF